MEWIVGQTPTKEIIRSYGIDCDAGSVLATLLWQRGVDAAVVDDFLNPLGGAFADPLDMRDMENACRRVMWALEAGDRICVYGDYDADGLTAQGILVAALRFWEARNPLYWTPHRENDGYGLHTHLIDEIANRGASLIVAVDCGIANAKEVAYAASLGIDFVILDHHLVPDEIPVCDAVVNPHQPSCQYAFKELSGAGLAYAFVRAMVRLGMPKPTGMAMNLMASLAAMGTIGDVVPLVGENRMIATQGIAALRRTTHPGLLALMKKARVPQADVDATRIAWAMVPMINAAGRIDSPSLVHGITMCADEPERDPEATAKQLDKLNRARQETARAMTAQAFADIEERLLTPCAEEMPVVVVGGEGWRKGLVGLVAGKVAERYHLPTLAYGWDPETGIATGSARSIPGLDIMAALRSQHNLFIKYGGHEGAAGFSFYVEDAQKLTLGLFDYVWAHHEPAMLGPVVRCDMELALGDVRLELYEDLQALAPFGQKNGMPIFLIRNLELHDARTMGATGDHLSLGVGGPGLKTTKALWFGHGHEKGDILEHNRIDLAAELMHDEYAGRSALALKMHAWRPA